MSVNLCSFADTVACLRFNPEAPVGKTTFSGEFMTGLWTMAEEG